VVLCKWKKIVTWVWNDMNLGKW